MRFVKLGLISIVVLFVVVILLSLLIPSHVRISRAINISANTDSIVNNMADIRRWKNWNNMVNDTTISNPSYDYKVFHSDQLQVELRSFKNDTVKTVWRQQNGKEIVGVFTWHTSGNTTVVQWFFDFYQEWYPWEKFGSIIFDKQLGPSMEKSLATLKKGLEDQP